MVVQWDTFSERVDTVLRNARHLAEQFHYPSITPELILLAILRDKDSLAGRVLVNFGIAMEFEFFISKLLNENPRPTHHTQSSLSSETEQILTQAQQRAQSSGHTAINTMDVLMSILDLGNGVLLVLQLRYGISLDQIRLEEKRVLRESPELLTEGKSLNDYRELGVPSFVLPN